MNRHPTRRHAYVVYMDGEAVGVVQRPWPRSSWWAERADGRLIASGYSTRADAVEAVERIADLDLDIAAADEVYAGAMSAAEAAEARIAAGQAHDDAVAAARDVYFLAVTKSRQTA